IRGKPKRIGGRVYFPMFHPAAALHQPRYRQALEEDIQKIPKLLAEARLIEAEPTLEEPQQMRLFLD
ncbi:MAG: uracil-DNA glycosylase, partial [Chloroflexi bacterium]|nr:uracil-DNA glycosylase [Chloroflexota bacterium]